MAAVVKAANEKCIADYKRLKLLQDANAQKYTVHYPSWVISKDDSYKDEKVKREMFEDYRASRGLTTDFYNVKISTTAEIISYLDISTLQMALIVARIVIVPVEIVRMSMTTPSFVL